MNIFAITTGILLLVIRSILFPFFNLMVQHGGSDELKFNLFHLFALTIGHFLIVYGIKDILWASLWTIAFLIFYIVVRLKNEYFEWRIK